MPYTNIVYVKFQLELLSDIRFTDQLDDEGKLVYIGLLLLAGLTKNNTPNNPEFIKRTLNLSLSLSQIRSKIDQIDAIFPMFLGKSQILKFKNFNKIHNYVGKSFGRPIQGVPIEEYSIEENSNKNPKPVLEYFVLKHKEKTSKDYVISWAKEMKILKDLLGILSEAEIKGRIDQFFEGKDSFREQAGYTVGVFKSQINRLGEAKNDGVWSAPIK